MILWVCVGLVAHSAPGSALGVLCSRAFTFRSAFRVWVASVSPPPGRRSSPSWSGRAGPLRSSSIGYHRGLSAPSSESPVAGARRRGANMGTARCSSVGLSRTGRPPIAVASPFRHEVIRHSLRRPAFPAALALPESHLANGLCCHHAYPKWRRLSLKPHVQVVGASRVSCRAGQAEYDENRLFGVSIVGGAFDAHVPTFLAHGPLDRVRFVRPCPGDRSPKACRVRQVAQ